MFAAFKGNFKTCSIFESFFAMNEKTKPKQATLAF
jgi:hypothetical protein